MKKLASLISAIVMATTFHVTCSAMQFQQPVFIGWMYGIKGGPASANGWTFSKEVNVKKDVITMGKGKTAIVFKCVLENVGGIQYRKIKSIVGYT